MQFLIFASVFLFGICSWARTDVQKDVMNPTQIFLGLGNKFNKTLRKIVVNEAVQRFGKKLRFLYIHSILKNLNGDLG